MERIVILGCAGTGKTTLARQLAKATGAPCICLDEIWQPDWTDEDVPRFRETLNDLHNQDRWISDGNFSAATFDIRLPRATQILWLERPHAVCILRSIARVLRKGERHQFRNLSKVIKFIWNFDRKNRPLIESLILKYGPELPVTQLHNDEEIRNFLRSVS
ncbi:MAG TPA: AAA family ATPase [Fimbriimonas sp.]|nr:AAA family ATPase [Fimbriimonas sp.]